MDDTVQNTLLKLKKCIRVQQNTICSFKKSTLILDIFTLLFSYDYKVHKLLFQYPLVEFADQFNKICQQNIATGIEFSTQTILTENQHYLYLGNCSCKQQIDCISYDENFYFSLKCLKCAGKVFKPEDPLYLLVKQAFSWHVLKEQVIYFNKHRKVIEEPSQDILLTNLYQYNYNNKQFAGKLLTFENNIIFSFFKEENEASNERKLKIAEQLFYRRIRQQTTQVIQDDRTNFINFKVEISQNSNIIGGFVLKEFNQFFIIQDDQGVHHQVKQTDCHLIGHLQNYYPSIYLTKNENVLIPNLLWNLKNFKIAKETRDIFLNIIPPDCIIKFCVFLQHKWYFLVSNNTECYIINFNEIVNEQCLQLHYQLYKTFELGQDMLECAKNLMVPNFYHIYLQIIIDKYKLTNNINNILSQK